MTDPNSLDYAGVRYPFCCGGCDAQFEKEPTKFIKKGEESKTPIGYSMFDPVSGAKLDLKKMPELSSDYKGTRFYFTSDEDKKAFDAEPKKYGTAPEKEVLFCTVMGHEVASYAEAGGYHDVGGVRYYFCCMDCCGAFSKDPSKYTGAGKDKVAAPKAMKHKDQ